ncbi:glycosyltransferase family 2 protein [Sphingomonas paeninsulae]|uniref:Glycosyltransferase family 2 protein n=1 Tax=Sphingomonas paeninsulae TaxID=2319844 RepID=A0A494TPV5_SPHPE|nr:glycosyltransferase family 2 protein [Sphingomonas paeninsulae]
MKTLEQTLGTTSPRLNPPARPWTGAVIWMSAVALFIALFAQGFVRMGVAAWAVGLVYILYDTALLIFVARRTYRLVGKPAAVSARPPLASLAVVVAAYNEAPVLQVTIEALLAQASPPELIVIADDGSDDDSATVLARIYGLRPPLLGTLGEAGTVAPTLRWLRLPRSGKARALNMAIPLIDADIVLTVDADTLLEPGALVAMRRAFDAEPKLVAATGVLRPICGDSNSGRIFQWFQTYEYVRNFMSRYAWMGSNSLLLISGAFAGFRREALVAVGGFDPECLVEDYEVMHRLHRYSIDNDFGWTVRVLGDAQASTDSPGTLMPFLRQRRRWFAGFLQTQLWNRDMIGNRRYGALGTAMMPVKSLDTVQPLYGLAAFALLITFIVTGNLKVALPVIIAMVAKVVIDLCYLLWSLKLYRHWTGQRLSPWGALASAVVEPLTFQLLRHAGAAWGWYVFLTKKQVWGTTARGEYCRGSMPRTIVLWMPDRLPD